MVSTNSDLRRQVARLADELARTQTEVATLRRGRRRPQLGDSSIDSGALEVRDPETGATRLRLGYQPDGSVGVVPEGGDPHPAPSVPVVVPIPSGLSVSWNGTLGGLEDLPSDFDHVNVHVSLTNGFTPTVGTFVGTITRSGGALPVAPLEVGETYYVRLVPVGTGGVQGAPSAQASGVPAPVGGVPGPGSITETEIADDAISTPKLQAEAVTALKIAAQAIEAGHIQAAAITASKLEADLVLGTRIIAGNPGGARVELDENGLRGYDAGDALVFAITDTGDAVFSGNIVASEISGSRILLETTSGTGGVIEQFPIEGVVRSQVTAASRARAQIQASPGQAELSVWGDHGDPESPAGGVIAQPGMTHLILYSNVSQGSNAPSMSLTAVPESASARWGTSTGSEVRVRALADWAAVSVTPEISTAGQPAATAGFIYAFRRAATDAPTLSLQSPISNSGQGQGRRSIIHVEGANSNRPSTVINHAAQTHYLQGELVDGETDTITDGVVQLASTHSVFAPRHAPVETVLDTNPTFNVSGSYVDFTSAQMPSVAFRTGWSGRVKISVMSAGYNNTGNDTNLRLAFRLSGAQTISAAPTRGTWMTNSGTGSTSRHMSTRIVVMNLQGNADYVLHPQWYSSNNGGAVTFSVALGNTIIVEPLM